MEDLCCLRDDFQELKHGEQVFVQAYIGEPGSGANGRVTEQRR